MRRIYITRLSARARVFRRRRRVVARRLPPAFLQLLMLHITRIPQRNKQHERTHTHRNRRTPREHPAQSLDLAARIRVQRDGDFVVEFLDLAHSQQPASHNVKERETHLRLHGPLLLSDCHFPVIK
jgi:hypothetical protein